MITLRKNKRISPAAIVERIKLVLLWKLLGWYADNHMDQWERWRIKGKEVEYYVTIDIRPDGYGYDDVTGKETE